MGVGRKPTPTLIKIARGTDRPCRTLPNEVNYDALQLPSGPEELDEAGRVEWERLYPQLSSRGLMTAADKALFLEWCFCVGKLHYIRQQLQNDKLIYAFKNRDGEKIPKVNPYIKAYDLFISKLLSISARFGFSPADRTRVGMPNRDTIILSRVS